MERLGSSLKLGAKLAFKLPFVLDVRAVAPGPTGPVAPAGFAFLALNGKLLALNGKYLVMEKA